MPAIEASQVTRNSRGWMETDSKAPRHVNLKKKYQSGVFQVVAKLDGLLVTLDILGQNLTCRNCLPFEANFFIS